MNNTKEENLIERYIIREYARVLGVLAPLAESAIPEALLMEMLSKEMQNFRNNVTKRVESGIAKAWDDSNKVTFALMDVKFRNVELPPRVKRIIYDANIDALNTFINRTKGGLTLSDRIWEQTKQARKIIKRGLLDGIKDGRPAYEIAKDIKEALINPFTKEPAPGIYKSPIKNAMRVVRTEVNASYRTADQKNWNKNPIVLGYKIEVSKTRAKGVKARCELCVTMQGVYPNTFQWSGFHPNCLCIKTPILMKREYIDKYNKLVARGEDTKENVNALRKEAGLINNLPSQLVDYVKTGRAKKMYWYGPNKKVIENNL